MLCFAAIGLRTVDPGRDHVLERNGTSVPGAVYEQVHRLLPGADGQSRERAPRHRSARRELGPGERTDAGGAEFTGGGAGAGGQPAQEGAVLPGQCHPEPFTGRLGCPDGAVGVAACDHAEAQERDRPPFGHAVIAGNPSMLAAFFSSQ